LWQCLLSPPSELEDEEEEDDEEDKGEDEDEDVPTPPNQQCGQPAEAFPTPTLATTKERGQQAMRKHLLQFVVDCMQLLAACVAVPTEATDQGLHAAAIASDVVVHGRVGLCTAGRRRLQQQRHHMHDALGHAAKDSWCDQVLPLAGIASNAHNNKAVAADTPVKLSVCKRIWSSALLASQNSVN